MKYFIGADIEAPHLSFYADLPDDPNFSGVWTWADENGMPVKGMNVIYFDKEKHAQDVVDILRITGAGIDPYADTIQVVALDLEDAE